MSFEDALFSRSNATDQEVLEGPEDELDSRLDALIREVDALLEGEEGEKRRKQGEQGLLDFQDSLTARGQGSAGSPNGANETTLPESGLCWEVERLRLDLEAGMTPSDHEGVNMDGDAGGHARVEEDTLPKPDSSAAESRSRATTSTLPGPSTA
ncbi:hypothetical protein RHOSPDRAFT_32158 [Rhodotorula sp. JG-1b]|nr:hypothetical protein RHOSPDRAFT_32158 [Rhodotorula sp. JG-1b]